MKLTPNFNLNEFTSSNIGERVGVKNTPSIRQIGNLTYLAEQLEKIRSLLRKPITISSGFRNPELNRLVGGSETSAHLEGLAADFTCPGYGGPKTICTLLLPSVGVLKIDQLVYEGTWVHVGFKPRGEVPRGETLTKHFVDGKVFYTTGIA